MLWSDSASKEDGIMIVASDLDRTLIYSRKAIAELGGPSEPSLKPVESFKGEWVSFMTTASFISLQTLFQEYLFVPVTTRTTEQYKRITLFQQELIPHYAITSNGAIILLDGIEMREWSEHLSAKLRNEAAPLEEISKILESEEILINSNRKQVESFFFYFILTKTLSLEDKHRLSKLAVSLGWKVSLQGRKLYFIPKAINKGDALKFVCSHSGGQALAGSGDSLLDLDFLKHCRYRLVPNHGELFSDPGIVFPEGIAVTKNQGVFAGEEILNRFLLL